MDFKTTQTIYRQIVDWIFEQILTGNWKEGEKTMSVRELAVKFEVNPNTVTRSFDFLQTHDIITNKRGIGFFTNEGAKEKITSIRKKEFMEEEVPAFVKNLKLLNIDINEIIEIYNKN